MPQITYKRTWCQTCNDWTLHNITNNDKLVCMDCNTEFSTIFLRDIPKDKLNEQRERYNKSVDPLTVLNEIIYESNSVVQAAKLFQSPGSDIKIIEEDAGQKKINNQRHNEYKELVKEREKLKEEALKYKGLNRNDTCICGSGKKYKQCCLIKFKNI